MPSFLGKFQDKFNDTFNKGKKCKTEDRTSKRAAGKQPEPAPPAALVATQTSTTQKSSESTPQCQNEPVYTPPCDKENPSTSQVHDRPASPAKKSEKSNHSQVSMKDGDDELDYASGLPKKDELRWEVCTSGDGGARVKRVDVSNMWYRLLH